MLLPLRQPAVDRSNWAVQLLRHLLRRQALQETEHNRLAVPLRQLAEFRVDHRCELITITAGTRPCRHFSGTQLVSPAPDRGRPVQAAVR